jgi:hypothetical protein
VTIPVAKRDEPLTQAELKAVVTLTQIPVGVALDKNGAARFEIEADGLAVSMIVRPAHWRRVMEANASGKPWQATISGRIGSIWSGGFVIYEPAVTQLKFL